MRTKILLAACLLLGGCSTIKVFYARWFTKPAVAESTVASSSASSPSSVVATIPNTNSSTNSDPPNNAPQHTDPQSAPPSSAGSTSAVGQTAATPPNKSPPPGHPKAGPKKDASKIATPSVAPITKRRAEQRPAKPVFKAEFDPGKPFPSPGRFSFHAPGEFPVGIPPTGTRDSTVHIPGMAFPITDAPAFIGPIAYELRKAAKLATDRCAPDIYSYPWRDTFCEPYHTGGGNGCINANSQKGLHQGEDISAGSIASCEHHWKIQKLGKKANLVKVVAVADGSITAAEFGKLKLMSGKTVFIYLHMNVDGLLVKRGDVVKRGQHIGYLWNEFTVQTLHHLHFEILKSQGSGRLQNVSPYMSLVEAYRSSTSTIAYR